MTDCIEESANGGIVLKRQDKGGCCVAILDVRLLVFSSCNCMPFTPYFISPFVVVMKFKPGTDCD